MQTPSICDIKSNSQQSSEVERWPMFATAPKASVSLTIVIQKERPADTSTSLPRPPAILIFMRFYRPSMQVLDHSYQLPFVKRVE